MKAIVKTNAARLLDKAKIQYSLVEYTVDLDNLAATHVAEELGENIKQVFKTLVLKSDKGSYYVCVIPGDAELNLKTVARLSLSKKVELIPMKDLLSVIGYLRGACSPIGMKKPFPVFIHNSCLEFNYIYISAGARGLQLKISPKDLINFVLTKVEYLLLAI